jgi:hypothetical protein
MSGRGAGGLPLRRPARRIRPASRLRGIVEHLCVPNVAAMLQPLDQRLEQQGGQLLAGHPAASE